MKVAIVHDYLNQYGGAERVMDVFTQMFPEAPIYTSIYEPSKMPARYRDLDIRTSFINKLPKSRSKHQAYLPLYPYAFESLDLSEYDLVLSDSSAFAKGVITPATTCHISYCHSPARFLWDNTGYSEKEGLGSLAQVLLTPIISSMRNWDRTSADRVDYYISTSRVIRERIRKFFRRDNVIIPPPVNGSNFYVSEEVEDYYLILMRLVGWKRPDIVVEACTRAGKRLIVVGDGRDEKDLRAMAGPTVEFYGRANDEQMRDLYAKCRAFILPSEEDFGITPLEAMASGRPVIAYGKGGVLDTVIPGVTGEFFAEQTADSLVEALNTFDPARYDPKTIRDHAMQFDTEHFKERMFAFIEKAMADFRADVPIGPLRFTV